MRNLGFAAAFFSVSAQAQHVPKIDISDDKARLVHTEERGVDSARCKDAIGTIVRRTNASVDHASPSGDNMLLRHPMAKDIVLSCASYRQDMMISLSWGGAFPPQLFYTLVAETGSILFKDPGSVVEKAAIRCQTRALKTADGIAETSTAHASLYCSTFTRDTGGTLITVSRKATD